MRVGGGSAEELEGFGGRGAVTVWNLLSMEREVCQRPARIENGASAQVAEGIISPDC
jgi:hypothetical protein